MIAADKHCHNSSTQHRTMSTPTEGRPQNLTVLRCIEFEVLPAVTIELLGASWVQLLNLLFAHTVLTTAGPICYTYYWGLHICCTYHQGLHICCTFSIVGDQLLCPCSGRGRSGSNSRSLRLDNPMSAVGPCVINYHVSWVQAVHCLTLCQNQINQKNIRYLCRYSIGNCSKKRQIAQMWGQIANLADEMGLGEN